MIIICGVHSGEYIIRVKAPLVAVNRVAMHNLGFGTDNMLIYYYTPENETRILIREPLMEIKMIKQLVELEEDISGGDW